MWPRKKRWDWQASCLCHSVFLFTNVSCLIETALEKFRSLYLKFTLTDEQVVADILIKIYPCCCFMKDIHFFFPYDLE